MNQAHDKKDDGDSLSSGKLTRLNLFRPYAVSTPSFGVEVTGFPSPNADLTNQMNSRLCSFERTHSQNMHEILVAATNIRSLSPTADSAHRFLQSSFHTD